VVLPIAAGVAAGVGCGGAAGVVGCAAGVADGAGCASAATVAIRPEQASADAIKKRVDAGDMDVLLFPVFVVLEGALHCNYVGAMAS
jgi:hypothetical protein